CLRRRPPRPRGRYSFQAAVTMAPRIGGSRPLVPACVARIACAVWVSPAAASDVFFRFRINNPNTRTMPSQDSDPTVTPSAEHSPEVQALLQRFQVACDLKMPIDRARIEKRLLAWLASITKH